MITKRIQWAYPSSDNARQFGCVHTGCWVVEIGPADYSKVHRAVAGFGSFWRAERYANYLDYPWDKLTASPLLSETAKEKP